MAEQSNQIIIDLHLVPSIVESGHHTYSIGYVNVVNSVGNPIRAPTNLEIKLASSNPDIASVPQSVIIPTGKDYAKFNVTANTDGKTSISAIYQDQKVSKDFTVGNSIGYVPQDTTLQLNIPSNNMLVNSEMPISVSLHWHGVVLPAPKDIVVSLDYDNSLIQPSTDKITIKKGSLYGMTTVKTRANIGNAYIKATCVDPPLDTVLNIKTSSSLPSSLLVNTFPRQITYSEQSMDIFVSLLDSSGAPTKAPEDIKVKLFSNHVLFGQAIDKTVGPYGATIKKGAYGVYLHQPFDFPKGGQEKVDSITVGASATGLGIATDTFGIRAPLELEFDSINPKLLRIYSVDNMPNNASSIVVYQLYTLNGTNTIPVSSNQVFTAASSVANLNVITTDNDNLQIISPGSILSGSSYGTAFIKSGQKSTPATVSVVLKGLVSASNTTNIVGYMQPTQTMLFSPAGNKTIAIDDKGNSEILVMLLDSQSRPITSIEGKKYILTPINELLEVPPGKTFTSTSILDSSLVSSPNTVDLTVSPIGVNADLSLEKKDSFQIQWPTITTTILTGMDAIIGDADKNPIGTVQLTDFYGNPVLAPNDLIVNLSSNNTNIVKVPSTVNIPKGSSFAEFPITTFGAQGIDIISANSEGFLGSQGQIQVKPVSELILPLNISIKPISTPISFNTDVNVKVVIYDPNYKPVDGVVVTFTSAQNATINPVSLNTDGSGAVQTIFRASSGPTTSLTVHASKDGYKDADSTITLDVSGLQAPTSSFVGIPSWVMYAGIGGAVAGIAVGVFVFLRKPKQVTPEESEEI
jgi:hypothetical protein